MEFVGTKWSIRNVDIYRTKQEKIVKNFYEYSLHNLILMLGWSRETLIIKILSAFPI